MLWLSSPDKFAAEGNACSPLLRAVNGLLFQAEVLLESVPRQEKKRRESAFLKDTFICPFKTWQFM